MNGYRLTATAAKQLDGIIDYIASQNPKAAQEFHLKTLESFKFLAEHPLTGRQRPELTNKPDLRFWAMHPNYLIAYKPTSPILTIHAIINVARDIPNLL